VIIAVLCAAAWSARVLLGTEGAHPPLVLSGLLLALLLAIAHVDFLAYRIPDLCNLALAALGAGAVALGVRDGASPADFVPEALVPAFASALIYGAVFWGARAAFLWWRGIVGLGLGDVKFAAAAGLWLPVEALPGFVLVASASGLAWAAARHARRGRLELHHRLAFGPHLALSLWCSWLSMSL
jgi:leader peptidase (prepilin peptidase)/N-methyltransferase